MSTPAGWYPDPYDERRLRYWDGAAWTESVSEPQPPPAPPTGPPATDPTAAYPQPAATPASDPPPFGQPGGPGGVGQGPPLFAPVTTPHGGDSGYGDVGEWLSDTFRVLAANVIPLVVFLLAVPLAGFVVLSVLGDAAFGSIRFTRNGTDVSADGLRAGTIVVFVIAAIATFLATLAGWLAANHHLHARHLGLPVSIGRSLGVGVRRLPRTIGWAIVGGLVAVLLVLAFAVVLAVLVTVLDSVPALGVLVSLVAFIGFLVAIVVLWVRLSFSLVAMAVAPSGTNPFTASWNLTRDRVLATLGRFLLLALIGFVVGLVINVVSQAVVSQALVDSFTVDDRGLLIDGVPIDDLDSFDLGDLLPGPGTLLVVGFVSAVGQAIQQAMSVAGATGLYARARGPHDE